MELSPLLNGNLPKRKNPFAIDQGDAGPSEKKKRGNDDYIVGWICALHEEYVAAVTFLDEMHDRPNYISHEDSNDYTLGRVGRHNVVVAVLPGGEYGIASATAVAKDMLRSFPNIRIGLMVGIAGGAPSPMHDIRLGDIVVSEPRGGHGGVFQYDFGKTIQGQRFHVSGFLDQPPRFLRTAVNGLKMQYEIEGHQLEESVTSVLRKNPNLWRKYKRPDPSSDKRYQRDFIHPPNSVECKGVCDKDPKKLEMHEARASDAIHIHYGLIASANQLMKDAQIRDRLALEKDVLCFEMEAAGLMNTFPCLVIRGICDYSDSHKNDEWQGYAAMVAAAYAKALLCRIPPTDVEVLRLIEENPSVLPRGKDKKSLSDEQKSLLVQSLRFEQMDVRQETIKNAHAKTCKWLLQTSQYLDWLCAEKLGEHLGFLWIKGKPGTGKSTLMKFALAHARRNMKDKIIVSFFFNARGDDLEKSTTGLYRSMLLQLLEKVPDIQHVFWSLAPESLDGERHHWSVEALKSLLEQAVQGLGKSQIVCFIDALDECDEEQIRDMISFFEPLGALAVSAGLNFRICFTSRHYPNISIEKCLKLTLEGNEGHSQDIVNYVDTELKIGHSRLAEQIRTELREKASGIFMWVVLVVGILNKQYDRGRIHELRKKLRDIPGDLHTLFHDMLTRDHHNKDELLLCIQWVLYARHPLKPEQLYYAILSAIAPEHLSNWNSDEITATDMKRFILDSSKGFVEATKSKNPTIQFIHESVKDFLLKENGLREIWSELGENFQGECHERLKQCCLNYMSVDVATYLDIGGSLPKATTEKAAHLRQSAEVSFPFLQYAVRNVLYHADAAEEGGVSQARFLETFRRVDWIKLDNLFEKYAIRRHKNASLLYILAEHDMANLLTSDLFKLYETCFQVEAERYGPPIFAALAAKSYKAVRVFLEAIISFHDLRNQLFDKRCQDEKEWPDMGGNFIFSKRRGILSHLVEVDKHMVIVNAFVLASNGFQNDCRYNFCQGPLPSDTAKGQEAVVQLLLEQSAEYRQREDMKPLRVAVENGRRVITKLLIEQGAEFESTDLKSRETVLLWAAEHDWVAIAKLLVEQGTSVEARPNWGQTPLTTAARHGQVEMAKFLVEQGANLGAAGRWGTPLSIAVQHGEMEMARFLIEQGANLGAKDILTTAARHGQVEMAKFLIEQGANLEAKDSLDQTPLTAAAQYGRLEMARFLIEQGANLEAKGSSGQTPLFMAVADGEMEMTRFLIERGANLEAKDGSGRTPLLMALYDRQAGVARFLIEQGANLEAKDAFGKTPLMVAVEAKRGIQLVTLLLERGANLNATDDRGRTALSMAEEPGVRKMLFEKVWEIRY
ncbi:Pfs, NB-ARC and ankyrin domain protein [Mariannaea sp. PMI_226]|nr:Pfs, NB-ARC and ankyrin domain protein [Mariannaea sp. PMI_226]